MNFVYISPNFPFNFYNFTRALKENGVNVFGIGDEDYDRLRPECRNSLDEYYKVSSLENYDEVYRAFAYFTHKYGRIDFVESNNEYWLMRDAMLRTDFNVNSGVKNDEISFIRYKNKMKECYQKAGVKVARFHLTSTLEEGLKFIEEVGYPVVVKPDDGVGASITYKISNEEELREFYNTDYPCQMIMEEFVNGELVSYDGICDSKRNVIFETSHIFPRQIMNVVNAQLDCFYWSVREIDEDLRKAGQATLKAFPSNRRFFHLEFFVMKEDKEGLGKKGDIIGLEVNMRPPGGPTLDMMNFASDVDAYRIWANMICYDEACMEIPNKKYFTVYTGRRNGREYVHSLDDIRQAYAGYICLDQDVPAVIAGAMGDYVLMGRFETEEEILPFVNMVIEEK